MSANDLYSSVVGWFRNSPDRVLDEIVRQSNFPYGRPGMRRMDIVWDATLRRNVQPAAQSLIRWSTAPPEEIFEYGFQPRVFPQTNQFPARAFNLRTYVAENHDSVFVSTTTPYRNAADHLTQWQRRFSQGSDIWHRFAYEIFAYGGIDVNRVLGVHGFDNQREIAFVGGIRPEMIRSAREYIGGAVIRIWINTNFDNTLNPPGENPPLAELPDVRRTPSDAEVRYFPGPGNPPLPPHVDHDEHRRRRRSADHEGTDPMFPASEGSDVRDPLFTMIPVPLSSVASVRNPTVSNRAWFFCGNRYSLINVNPGAPDTIQLGPRNIVNHWPSLWTAGFTGGVDAVLPNPHNSREMYFFSKGYYARIDIGTGATDDRIINGPTKIVDGWPSLRTAGFATIDAVLPHPVNSAHAYFFSGSQYALINIQPGTSNDHIVSGPRPFLDYWPSLRQAGFSRVDTILPNPANIQEAYFFSGTQYALIRIQAGSVNDSIVFGPRAVRDQWRSLSQSGFW